MTFQNRQDAVPSVGAGGFINGGTSPFIANGFPGIGAGCGSQKTQDKQDAHTGFHDDSLLLYGGSARKPVRRNPIPRGRNASRSEIP
jgi:hypothetical protein